MGLKLIGVTDDVKSRLDALGTRKDTYNSIISSLLDYYRVGEYKK